MLTVYRHNFNSHYTQRQICQEKFIIFKARKYSGITVLSIFELGKVEKFGKVLDGVLVKLSRYDEGTFSSTVLSFTKPTMETANEFIKV